MLRPEENLLQSKFEELENRGLQEFQSDGLSGDATRSVDLRYVGQGYELNVPYNSGMISSFHRTHRQRYGYADEGRTVEVVNIRVRITAKADPIHLPQATPRPGDGSQAVLKTRRMRFDRQEFESQVYDRDRLVSGDVFTGPAVVAEYSATTVLPPDCEARVDTFRNLVIAVGAVPQSATSENRGKL
jgi:N-methylhydantoinase A